MYWTGKVLVDFSTIPVGRLPLALGPSSLTRLLPSKWRKSSLIDALAQLLQARVLHAGGVTSIGDTGGQLAREAQALVHLPQQQGPPSLDKSGASQVRWTGKVG